MRLFLLLLLLLLLFALHASFTAASSDTAAIPTLPIQAQLDAYCRLVTFQRSATANANAAKAATSSFSSSPSYDAKTAWLPLRLPSSGPQPTALASGFVWSLPSLTLWPNQSADAAQPDLTSSTQVPLLIIAFGRTLRLYTPAPSLAPNVQEFTQQQILLAGATLVAEVRSALCVCGMKIVPMETDQPTSTNDTAFMSILYLYNSHGSLDSIKLQQSRIVGSSTSGSASSSSTSPSRSNNMAMLFSEEEVLIRTRNDPDGAFSTSMCPPCSHGDIISLNTTSSVFSSSQSPVQQGGMYYSPKQESVKVMMKDLNQDGLLDYVILRSNLSANLIKSTSITELADTRSQLGFDVIIYMNRGVVGSGKDRFESVGDVVVKGGRTNGVAMQQQATGTFHSSVSAGADLEAISYPHHHEELSADLTQSRSRRVRTAIQVARNASFMVAASDTASATNHTSAPSHRFFTSSSLMTPTTPVTLMRIVESFTFGQFDSDRNLDMVVAVTEFVEGSALGGADLTMAGVTIRRRLITLFGTNSNNTNYRFDTGSGDAVAATGSVSNEFPEATAFLQGVKLLPPVASSASSSSTSLRPLLSHMISLQSDHADTYDSLRNISILLPTISMRPSSSPTSASIPLPATASVDLGFQAFPFVVNSIDSPFYVNTDGDSSSSSSSTASQSATLQTFQQSSLVIARHDFAHSSGLLYNMFSDSRGIFNMQSVSDVTEEEPMWSEYEDWTSEEHLRYGWSANNASLIRFNDRSSIRSSISDIYSVLPSLELGPHASIILSSSSSPITYGHSAYELSATAYYVDSILNTQGVALSPIVESSTSFFSSPLLPQITSSLNSTSASLYTSPAKSEYYTLLQHDLQVAEWFHSAGWTAVSGDAGGVGDQVNLIGIELVKGTEKQPEEWRKIKGSPVTWCLLALFGLILLFLGCLLYRRRERLFAANHQHILEEIRTVLEVEGEHQDEEMGGRRPQHQLGRRQQHQQQQQLPVQEISPSSPRSLPNTSDLRRANEESDDGLEVEEQKSPIAQPLAPPNTGAIHDQQAADELDNAPPLLGVGEIIHAPRIEAQTATAHPSAPPSAVAPSSAGSTPIHLSSPAVDELSDFDAIFSVASNHSSPSLSMLHVPPHIQSSASPFSSSPFFEVSPAVEHGGGSGGEGPSATQAQEVKTAEEQPGERQPTSSSHRYEYNHEDEEEE